MSISTAYKPFLKSWKPEYGKKPTKTEINKAETVARPGSKVAFALAMGMTPSGTTQSTIIKVLGLPHRNKIKQLTDEKKLKVRKSGKRPSTLHLDVR